MLTPDQCVGLTVVEPALNAATALAAQIPAKEPGGWTPTDKALDHVVNTLPIGNMSQVDANPDPVYVLLATDGAPNDRCVDRRGGGMDFDAVTAQRVVDTVTRGVQGKMKLFVVSLAGQDAQLRQHLEQLVQIAATGEPLFEPATKDQLVSAFQKVIGQATCQVKLMGKVETGKECQGQVMLNGAALPCNSDNGWRMPDPSTVQLTGSACMQFVSTASQVDANFPCAILCPDC